MSQDLKCYLGVHKYEITEKVEIRNTKGELISHTYISRCTNCGKIKVDNVNF